MPFICYESNKLEMNSFKYWRKNGGGGDDKINEKTNLIELNNCLY